MSSAPRSALLGHPGRGPVGGLTVSRGHLASGVLPSGPATLSLHHPLFVSVEKSSPVEPSPEVVTRFPVSPLRVQNPRWQRAPLRRGPVWFWRLLPASVQIPSAREPTGWYFVALAWAVAQGPEPRVTALLTAPLSPGPEGAASLGRRPREVTPAPCRNTGHRQRARPGPRYASFSFYETSMSIAGFTRTFLSVPTSCRALRS